MSPFWVLAALSHLLGVHGQSLRGTLHKSAADPEGTATVFDPTNESWAVQNLISCRYGVICHGTEVWRDGKPTCEGTLVCRTQGAEDASWGGGNGASEMKDGANTTTAVANLLVCRYGSYCRGGWWYHYGRRECRGGIVCRHGPYYASSETSDSALLSKDSEAGNGQDGAMVVLSPVEPTYDPVNESHGFSNLISCRFGVVCHGTWLWINGVRKCSGALVCKSGFKEVMNVGSEVDASGSGSNFTTMMQDSSNTTTAVANLLVCRYGSYCRGGWWYHYGRRECRGGIVCRHGPYYASAEESRLSRAAPLLLFPGSVR